MKATQHSLDKLEELYQEIQYKVRYEKGNFKSGACVLLESKVIVVNKFSTLENKINALVELLGQISFDESLLTEKNRIFYRTLQQTQLTL